MVSAPRPGIGRYGKLREKGTGEVNMLNDKVVKILRGFAKTQPDAVNGDHRLKEDLGISSVDIVKIIVEIEEELDVEIDMAAIRVESFRTVASVAKLVEEIVSGSMEQG
jgi:acyl carrier protein